MSLSYKEILFLSLTLAFFSTCRQDAEIEEEQNTINIFEEERNNALSFLALGDSYSVGEGLEGEQNWPERLFDSIKKNEDTIKIIAETGFSTNELIQAIDNVVLEKRYNLISIQIGVNDQFRGNSTELFKQDFQKLVQRIKENEFTKLASVFVVSIPDWGATPFGSSWDRIRVTNEIDAFNRIIKGVCYTNNILYIDITQLSRSDPNNWIFVTGDGLHPSSLMYGLWLDKITPLVKELLK